MEFVSTLYSAVTTVAGYMPEMGSKHPLEVMKCEGFTSAIRIAMFPYKPKIKLKIDEFAINFETENKVCNVDLNSVKRYMHYEGRNNFIIILRIFRMMFDLHPPVLITKDNEGKEIIEPITNCYLHMIKGLKYIKKNFFSDHKVDINPIYTAETLDFEYDAVRHKNMAEIISAEAIESTIHLLQFYCFKEQYKPKEKIGKIYTELKNSYTPMYISKLSNDLNILKVNQKDIPVNQQWLVEHDFNSLDDFLIGRIKHYQKLTVLHGVAYPRKSEQLLINSASVEEKEKDNGGEPYNL